MDHNYPMQPPLDPRKILSELYVKNLELYRERSRIHEIIQQVAEVVFAVDQDYKITLFNKTAEAVFNFSQEKAAGMSADRVVKLSRDEVFFSVKEYAFKKEATLKEINKKGTTVVMATHNAEIVNSLKERVVLLKKGEIIDDNEKGGYKDL